MTMAKIEPDNTTSSSPIVKRSFAAMGGVFISRFSGVIRTMIVNAVFGANVLLDSFNLAFRFPNSLRDLFADGALSAALMKTLVDEKAKGVDEEKKLISITCGFFLFVTLLLSLLAVVFAKPFVALISDAQFANSGGLTLATHLFQLLIFYLPLTMLNAIVMAMLGVHNMNFRAMNGSLFLSVGMVLGALGLAPLCKFISLSPVYGLTVGALLGAIMQLIYQIIPLLKLKLIPIPQFNPMAWLRYPPLKQMLYMMMPRALGQGASTLALMINTFFAIQIGQGMMTYVATTVIIIQVPIGLFGVATGFASLPVLSDAVNQKDFNKFSRLFIESIDITLWLALMTTLAFALFMVPAYYLIFQHGKIHYYDTLQNSIAICAYASGIIFSAGSKVLINGLYALNRTRYIVYNSLVYLIVNAALTAYLAPRYGLVGLGLAYGIASAANLWLNYFLVYYAYRQQHLGFSPFSAGGKGYKDKLLAVSLLAFMCSYVGIWFINYYWTPREHSITALHAFLFLAIGGGLYAFICFFMTQYFGPSTLRTACAQLRKKMF